MHFCARHWASMRAAAAAAAADGLVTALGRRARRQRHPLRDAGLVLAVLGILGGRDVLCELRGSDEEQCEQRGAEDARVDEHAGGDDAEEVEGPPERELAEEVGVAAVLEEPAAVETGLEVTREWLLGRNERVLRLVEIPLLLIGDGLEREEAQEEHGRETIYAVQRQRGGPAVHVGCVAGQRDEEEQEVLVAGDEDGVEELVERRVQVLAHDCPAVVLLAEPVAALAPEVEREPQPPE